METAPQYQESSSPASSQSMWHPDGDFIIKVVKDGETHLHRIHGFLLRLHSEILRDMFAMGGSTDQEKLHGCPIVQFYDDPKDVYQLLQVLYYPGSLPHEKLRRKTFDELEPVLRLADKYEMRDLVRRLLPMLEQDWPSSLMRWDANEAEIKLLAQLLQEEQDETGNYGDANALDEILPEPCRVIRLARQCAINSVLPTAFYHLSRLSDRQDEDPAELDPTDPLTLGRRAERRYLSAEDWSALYYGMGRIRRWCQTMIGDFIVEMTEYPLSMHDAHSKCPASLAKFIPAMERRLDKGLFGTNRAVIAMDPLDELKDPGQLLKHVDGYQNLCALCGNKAHHFLSGKREMFWKELPSFFELPSWGANRSSGSGSRQPGRTSHS